MLTLITDQNEFEMFLALFDWHSSYIKEIHFANSQFELSSSDVEVREFNCPSICGTTISLETSLLRLLIALPDQSGSLEIIAFDPEHCSFSPRRDLEEQKSALVKRRIIEADFGAFSLKCASMAYRMLAVGSVGFDQCYNKSNLFDKEGKLLEPYNLDWRTALDDAIKIRQSKADDGG